MTLRNRLMVALMLPCLTLLAAEDELPELEPAEAVTPAAGDTAKVLRRWNFDEGADGWDVERMEQSKPWNVFELVKEGFRGSAGSIRTTEPSQWTTLGPFVPVEYSGAEAKVTFAYKTRNCSGVIAQGKVKALGKQLHGTAASFTDGRWTVETLECDKWVPWSGNESGKQHQFSTLMVYVNAVKGKKSEYLLDDVVLWQGKDVTPPERVRRARADVDVEAGEVVLKWEAPKDAIAVARFEIHRGITPGFVPNPKSLLAVVSESSFRDGTLNNFGTYYYRLIAEDQSGNVSGASKAIKVQVSE